MQKYNFTGKKIGIWGAGIVGKSAITFFKQEQAIIQLLNKNKIESLDSSIQQLEQTDENIKLFFESNEYILCSPGIPLHNYQAYGDKIITELDIIQDRYKKAIIAITGTAGKTTITHLLHYALNQKKPTIAAGNIGYPMLNLLTKDHKEELAIIETSSFQLQHTKSFAPNCAIITNFFLNHLDYHKSATEYKEAKNQLIRYQTKDQIKIVPPLFAYEKNSGDAQSYITTKDKTAQSNFYIKDNSIWHNKTKLCDLNNLPTYTFPENWLTIIAALYLNNVSITDKLCKSLHQATTPDHRLKAVATIHGTTFYNDSKSTIWQSTAEAIKQVEKPAALLLGGLSKNIDRTPLFKEIADITQVTIFAFGKESTDIKTIAQKYKCKTVTSENLDICFKQCMNHIKEFKTVLFSPGGSSFDLFKNFQERGKSFETLVHNHLRNMQT